VNRGRATAMLSFLLGVAACGVAEFPPKGNVSPDSASSGFSFVDGGVLTRDQIVVFLHVGHSNMAGRAFSPPELEAYNYETDPHLWSYDRGGAWTLAHEPLSPDQNTGDRAGPGMSILRSALAMAPDHYMVSIGHGQSGALNGRCLTFRKGGLFYDLAMSRAIELKGRVTFGAIFTMFGISEDNDPDGFGACMEGLAKEMRGDLEEPDLPFMVGDWETGAETQNGSQSGPLAQAVIPQLRALPTHIARSAVIPTDMLPLIPADHHYDFVGHKLWAERGIAILWAKGWAPWASHAPPSQ
jgi:hypothetical protein